jgi:c-di-GMP-binding flagellar brake protein YcgR
MAQERRVHNRAELVLSLRIAVEGRTVVGTSADISVGGLRAMLPENLPFGTKVKVIVHLPALPDESVIDAEVRWCQAEAGGGFSVGLQFLRVRPLETWAINQIIRGA